MATRTKTEIWRYNTAVQNLIGGETQTKQCSRIPFSSVCKTLAALTLSISNAQFQPDKAISIYAGSDCHRALAEFCLLVDRGELVSIYAGSDCQEAVLNERRTE
jgi:hypothetical protein